MLPNLPSPGWVDVDAWSKSIAKPNHGITVLADVCCVWGVAMAAGRKRRRACRGILDVCRMERSCVASAFGRHRHGLTGSLSLSLSEMISSFGSTPVDSAGHGGLLLGTLLHRSVGGESKWRAEQRTGRAPGPGASEWLLRCPSDRRGDASGVQLAAKRQCLHRSGACALFRAAFFPPPSP